MCRRICASSILVFLCVGTLASALGQTGPPFAPVFADSTGLAGRSRFPDLEPHLRYPNARPMPLSLPAEDDHVSGPPGKVVSKNLITGEITEREGVTLSDILDLDLTAEQEQTLLDMTIQPDLLDKDFNGWGPVSDPTAGTYPRRVKIWMAFTDVDGAPVNSWGSGTLIDPMHVITAGHCIYSHDNPDEGIFIYDYADGATVSPGYQDNVSPWGTADAVEFHIWTPWKEDRDRDHDVGVIDLDRPVGLLTGWFNIGQNPDCDYFLGGTWEHVGYPNWTDPRGELMYTAVGDYDWCSWMMGGGNLVFFDSPSGGGTSGSGAVRDGTVWAVHAAGNDDESIDVVVTEVKFWNIMGYLHDDWPANPDLWPLQVVASPEAVSAGDTLASFEFVLGNVSEQGYTGGVNCYLYLSTDDHITTEDQLLNYQNVQVVLPPRGAQTHAIPPPIIPLETDPGDYFLGVIIDIADADQSNNVTSGFDLDVIAVDCARPPVTYITSPPNSAECQPTTVTIDWMDVPGVENYILQVGGGCEVGTNYVTGTTSQYTISGLNNGQTYYARVLSINYCGSNSFWSSCKSFTTEPIPSPYYTFTGPPEGDLCQDHNSVTVSWDPMPRVDFYQIKVGETCGLGAIYNVYPPLTEYTFPPLLDGMTYYYQARTMDTCGNWGAWSDCGSFSTLPVIYTVPQGSYPPEGYGCVGTSPILSWQPVDYPANYEVEWGTSCRMDTTTIVSGNYVIIPQLAEGTWYWHVRAIHDCGGSSSYSDCYSFGVDGTAPIWPGMLESFTHEVSTWSGNPEVTTYWEDATDACNVEYRVLWDHLPGTVPDTLAQTIPDQEHTSEPLPTASDHWVHVLAKDVPGNLAVNPQHLGPFWIDVTPPSVLVTHPVGGMYLIGGEATHVSWDAVDPASGLASFAAHYTLDAGATWHLIGNVADPLAVTMAWTLPDAVTDSAQVRVTAVDAVGNSGQGTNERWFYIGSTSAVGDAPAVSLLNQNVPNPFNPRTTIRYELAGPETVSLKVFDVSGKLVRTLLATEVASGHHEVTWSGKDDTGREVPAGVYFYRLEAGNYRETKRMVLIK